MSQIYNASFTIFTHHDVCEHRNNVWHEIKKTGKSVSSLKIAFKIETDAQVSGPGSLLGAARFYNSHVLFEEIEQLQHISLSRAQGDRLSPSPLSCIVGSLIK